MDLITVKSIKKRNISLAAAVLFIIFTVEAATKSIMIAADKNALLLLILKGHYSSKHKCGIMFSARINGGFNFYLKEAYKSGLNVE